MARPMSRLMDAKRWLWAVVVALAVVSVLPARLLGWAGWFGTLVQTLVVPVSHPVSRLVRAAAPGSAGSEDEATRAWRLRAEEYEALYLRERDRTRELRGLLEEMRAVVALSPDVSVRHLAAPVVAGSSDLSSGMLSVRVPVGDGSITPGTTVAVVEGVQILGRVDSVRGWNCQVRPVTDASSGRVEGVVVLGDGVDAPRLRCSLTPTGQGTLSGPVEDPGSLGLGEALRPGLRVRLSDPTWPESAQQLVLGAIERVEANPDQPLRRLVVVRPLVELSRVSDVVLRIPSSRDGGADGGGAP